jgi:hypothetical protein
MQNILHKTFSDFFHDVSTLRKCCNKYSAFNGQHFFYAKTCSTQTTSCNWARATCCSVDTTMQHSADSPGVAKLVFPYAQKDDHRHTLY